MREKDIMEKMQSEVIIPDVVQERAELAFEKIRKKEGKLEAGFDATDEQKQLLEEEQYTAPLNNESSGNGENGNSGRDNGNSGGNSGDSGNSVTVQGVTITPQQSIVDSRFAWLSFKVKQLFLIMAVFIMVSTAMRRDGLFMKTALRQTGKSL